MKNPAQALAKKMAMSQIRAIEKSKGKEQATIRLIQVIATEMAGNYKRHKKWTVEKLADYDDDMIEFFAEYDVTRSMLREFAKIIIEEKK